MIRIFDLRNTWTAQELFVFTEEFEASVTFDYGYETERGILTPITPPKTIFKYRDCKIRLDGCAFLIREGDGRLTPITQAALDFVQGY